MPSLAGLILDRHDAGLPVVQEFDALPAWQMGLWFEDLREIGPSLIALGVERRPGNALNVEIGAPVPRCDQRSPDGRGMAWLWSGGSALAYGCCSRRSCPKIGGAS